MDYIRSIIQKEKLTGDDIVSCFDAVGKNGDVIIFKLDGVRKENKYSVIITSGNSTFEPIRRDASNLEDALKSVMSLYFR